MTPEASLVSEISDRRKPEKQLAFCQQGHGWRESAAVAYCQSSELMLFPCKTGTPEKAQAGPELMTLVPGPTSTGIPCKAKLHLARTGTDPRSGDSTLPSSSYTGKPARGRGTCLLRAEEAVGGSMGLSLTEGPPGTDLSSVRTLQPGWQAGPQPGAASPQDRLLRLSQRQ